MSPIAALTVAGVDPTGGAGATADLRTFAAHGLWGMVAVTAVTAQWSGGGSMGTVQTPELVADQIRAVHHQHTIAATKTGMLGSAAVMEAVAAFDLAPLVVDPVLVATTGLELAESGAAEALRTLLVPKATVVTPNVHEAAALVGFAVDDRAAAEAAGQELRRLGAEVALVTGGHLEEDGDVVADCLVSPGGTTWVEAPRLDVAHTHGSGCVLAAAICASLARGMEPEDACVAGIAYAQRAVAAAVRFAGGGGAVDPPPEA